MVLRKGFRVRPTPIAGCFVVESDVYEDVRGTFEEAFNAAGFSNISLPEQWAQDNISHSKAGVCRGLHIQRSNPQGKLVRCLSGHVYDVCVDLRKDSPTKGRYFAMVLNGEMGEALYCPPGTAHGFQVMSDRAVVYYKCTTLYDPSTDGGIRWDDPSLGIQWPYKEPILSEKDKNLPPMALWLAGS